MSIYDYINDNKYYNSKRWPGSAVAPEYHKQLRREYNLEKARLRDMFYQDLCEDSGVPDDNKSRRVFDKAWEDGHSNGLQEVCVHWYDLWSFLDSL